MFRGFLQGLLRERYGRIVATVGQAAVFAIAHLGYYPVSAWPLLFVVFLVGIVEWLVDRRGTLLAAGIAHGVSAVVAQVPFVDGPRTALTLARRGGIDYLKTGLVAGLRDLGRALLRRRPYYVPLVGPPDEFAILNTPDARRGVQALIPDDEGWDNRCPARIALTSMAYRPLTRASDVDAPVFVAQATEDTIIPAATIDRLVRELDDVERVRYSVGHFDAYVGEPFEALVDREIGFLVRHLHD